MPVRINEGIELQLHLTRLRGVKHALVKAAPNVLLHEEGKLKGQTQASVFFGFEALWEQVAVFGLKGSVARIRIYGCTGDDGCAPIGAEMVFH